MSFKTPLVLLLVLTFLIGADYLSAWVAPAAMPPASNVAAPLNTGATNQVKPGGLSLNTLYVTGATMFGVDATPEANLLLDVNGRVGASEYCDENGANCVTSSGVGGTGGGLGYNQSWREVARTSGVWYQNNTPQPIMVFHKNISAGTLVYVGPSTTVYTQLDFRDFDSDLDNGSTFVVPPGHWYWFATATENAGNGHRKILELR